MQALLLGRFHALTRGQVEVIDALGREPSVERIACVVTSADHQGSRRNPLPAATREAILRPALAATGKPFALVRMNDVPDDARWPSLVVEAVRAGAGWSLSPTDTRVVTSNREVATLFRATGFPVDERAVSGLPPSDLIERIVRGRPWREEAAPSTIAVYEAEGVPARLAAIYGHGRRTDDGELAHHRDFDSYGAQMDASLVQKLEDLVPWVEPGLVVDKGCGTGKLLVELSRRFPSSAYVGVDLSREFLRRCDENTYFAEDVSLVLGDAADAAVEPGTATTVIFSSIMHEIYTYSGYDQRQVDRALDSAARELVAGGRLLIRDGVSPGRAGEVGPWRLRFLDDETAATWERFARELKRGEGAPYERLGPNLVETSAHLANEFLCKKDYQKNWHIEVHEEFGVRTVEEWRAALVARGVEPTHLRAYANPWIVAHRYQGRVELTDAEGRPLPWPATNVVVVGTKRP